MKLFKRKRKQKQPENVRSLSQKLLMREMKKDPTFGLEVAKREMRYHDDDEHEYEGYEQAPSERPPFKEYMSNVREMKSFMEEFKGEVVPQSPWQMIYQGIGQGIGQALGNILAPMANQLAQNMAKEQGVQIEEEPPQRLPEQPKPRLQKGKPTDKREATPKHGLNIGQLTKYMDMPPEQAIEELKEHYPAWLPLLKLQTTDGILSQLEPHASEDPLIQEIYTNLSSEEGRNWLDTVIELAKSEEKQ